MYLLENNYKYNLHKFYKTHFHTNLYIFYVHLFYLYVCQNILFFFVQTFLY